MKNVCFFSEMKLFEDQGPVNSFVKSKIEYNKSKVIEYLKSGKRIASCPRKAIDCFTGEKISDSFVLLSDGEFCWGDFLIYHLNKYDINLPEKLLMNVGR